ncbi:glycosyltransferase [Marinilabilia rubra]|uniref:Glycosyl transferase family 1 n=1 Tax=Marinilabilia rubra TaxID=2162893 RepID=A0A2U2B7H7_9BACT|nr:glycosyltransferase [Marinilabilia rubra]PWD98994.1 glycosyl transferase family 1 [Marinilabilia rubra]
MKQPKLLYAAEVHLPGQKASSIHVMRMCKAFANQGIQVRLLAFRSPTFKNKSSLLDYYGIDGDMDVKLVNAPGTGRIAAFWLAITAFFQVLRFKPSIAYTRSVVSAYFMSLVAGKTAFEAHTFLFQKKKGYAQYFFKKLIQKSSFLGLVVISEALKKMYVEKGIAEKNIFVAHDGADEKSLNYLGELTGGYAFNAGYFGSVFAGRGVDVIIEMAERMPETGFHIFGGEKNQVNHNGHIPQNLMFYGFVSPSEVHQFRNACDVLLAPYQPDVFVSAKQAFSTSSYMSPLKIFEYMSARKPIIVSDMPVLKEVLSEETAMMVPSGDSSAWVRAVKDLKQDKDKRENMADKAYQEFINYYTWKKRASLIFDWLSGRIS